LGLERAGADVCFYHEWGTTQPRANQSQQSLQWLKVGLGKVMLGKYAVSPKALPGGTWRISNAAKNLREEKFGKLPPKSRADLLYQGR
jgi:hypothetical protein